MDQSAGMLDDDVKEKGYALLCVSTPQSDCRIRTIEEVRLWFLTLLGAHACTAHRCTLGACRAAAMW